MEVERNEIWLEDQVQVRRIHSKFRVWLRSWWSTRVMQALLALGLFLWSGPLLHLWDPTAGVLDIGVLSMLPLAMLVVALARLSAAGVYNHMVESLNQLTLWQRTLCYGCLYLSYFWAMIWVVVSLI
ncbi:hypothetical protein [Parapedobacter tibetensis]|uniref:hypothetical protein n=1 Tax=Parapedobacter tibetensis TaxID=2972951 RepID=UPI00214D387A|nr:hypothetical protein [Parapedobacter tibetensis]